MLISIQDRDTVDHGLDGGSTMQKHVTPGSSTLGIRECHIICNYNLKFDVPAQLHALRQTDYKGNVCFSWVA